METRKPTFEEFRVLARQRIDLASADLSAHTRLDRVHALAIKLAYFADVEGLPSLSPKLHVFAHSMLHKMTNEILAACGCIRAGTVYGAWHHVRAILETHAAIHHVLTDAAERDARLTRFIEYPRLVPWRTRFAEVQAGRGPESIVSEGALADATQSQIETWMKLYDCKSEKALAKLPRWHSGSITALIDALDSDGTSARMYSRMCHPTHASPLGRRLSGWSQQRALGFDIAAATSVIDAAAAHSYLAIKSLDRAMDGALVAFVAPELTALA